jgi:hypothetical protein
MKDRKAESAIRVVGIDTLLPFWLAAKFAEVFTRDCRSSIHQGNTAMEDLKVETKPTSFNILKRHYIKVVKLHDYIKQTVSERRNTRIEKAATDNESLKTLLSATYVCMNPQHHLEDDDDMNEISILSNGEYSTQADVNNQSILC